MVIKPHFPPLWRVRYIGKLHRMALAILRVATPRISQVMDQERWHFACRVCSSFWSSHPHFTWGHVKCCPSLARLHTKALFPYQLIHGSLPQPTGCSLSLPTTVSNSTGMYSHLLSCLQSCPWVQCARDLVLLSEGSCNLYCQWGNERRKCSSAFLSWASSNFWSLTPDSLF